MRHWGLLSVCLIAAAGCEVVPRPWVHGMEDGSAAAALDAATGDAADVQTTGTMDASTPDRLDARVSSDIADVRDVSRPSDLSPNTDRPALSDVPTADRVVVDGGSPTQRSCTPSAVAGCGMAFIPGATFTMGDGATTSPSPAQPNITVSGFYMDRFEVTVARFRRFYEQARSQSGSVRYPNGATARYESARYLLGQRNPDSTIFTRWCTWTPTASDTERLPINCLTWHAAQGFCAWDGGRLPTEAEWELAARGPEARPFPWGASRAGVTTCHAPAQNCIVDDPSFAASETPQGLVHLSGNVAEMTADRYTLLGDVDCWGGRAQVDPLCAPTGQVGTNITLRGDAHYARVAVPGTYRYPQSVTGQINYIGFRCARSLP